MFFKDKVWFTFIEIIITITIIGVLSSIVSLSLSEWFSKSNDTKRIWDLNIISSSLENYKFENWYYPEPEDFLKVEYWTSDIWHQGYVGKTVSDKIELKNYPKDPSTKEWYTYLVNQDKNKFQILTYLDTKEYKEKFWFWNLSNKVFAEYTNKTPLDKGYSLWIMISSWDKTPMNYVITWYNSLNLKDYNKFIEVIFDNQSTLVGTWKTIMRAKTLYRSDLSVLDKELFLYFDMDESIWEELEWKSFYNNTWSVAWVKRVEWVQWKWLYLDNSTWVVTVSDSNNLDLTWEFLISMRINPLEKTNSEIDLLKKWNDYIFSISGSKIFGKSDTTSLSWNLNNIWWHNIVLRNTSSNLQFYIDGQKISETSTVSISNNDDLIIWNKNDKFYGSIDEIRIYKDWLDQNLIEYFYNSLK